MAVQISVMSVGNFKRLLGPFQTSNFTCAESNANEKNLLFSLIRIRFGTCKVRRLKRALDTFRHRYVVQSGKKKSRWISFHHAIPRTDAISFIVQCHGLSHGKICFLSTNGVQDDNSHDVGSNVSTSYWCPRFLAMIAQLFLPRAWSTVWAPFSKSSTYRLLRNAATVSGIPLSQAYKYSSITTPQKERWARQPKQDTCKSVGFIATPFMQSPVGAECVTLLFLDSCS